VGAVNLLTFKYTLQLKLLIEEEFPEAEKRAKAIGLRVTD
jgi:hypothetical protein